VTISRIAAVRPHVNTSFAVVAAPDPEWDGAAQEAPARLLVGLGPRHALRDAVALCLGKGRSEWSGLFGPLARDVADIAISVECPLSSIPAVEFLRRRPRNHRPRHFGVKPANAVCANNKIGWIENVFLDEIQHRSIDPRSLWLH
jgi:hypothetical protein